MLVLTNIMIRVIYFELTCLLIVWSTICVKTIDGSTEVNEKTKQKIEDAGCEYWHSSQLLERNVCLRPDYHPTEMPRINGTTEVKMDLRSVRVLEVDEMKHRVTVKISQTLEWWEPRISANFSNVDNLYESEVSDIKLSPRNFGQFSPKVWHPNLDIFTWNLEAWKSLYDPQLYKDVILENNTYVTGDEVSFKLNAQRDWKATILCDYDFSSFPFDTQHCYLMQFGGSQSMNLTLNTPTERIKEWDHVAAGFNVTIIPYNHIDARGIGTDFGFHVFLTRIVQQNMYKYYFPTFAIVVVSQFSFIIPLSAIPGRVALVVTQFLTLTNVFII